MWGFSSRSKEDGGHNSSSSDMKGDPKSSPSKKSKRKLVGRRQRNSQTDKSESISNNNSSGKSALGFSTKSNGSKLKQQHKAREEEEEDGSGHMDPNESAPSSHYYHQHHQQQQHKHSNLKHQLRRQHSLDDPQRRNLDLQEPDYDESPGQGIEILLDFNKAAGHGGGGGGHSGVGKKYSKYGGGPPTKPVLSLADHVLQRCKIHTAQFSVFFPVASTDTSNPSLPASLEKNRRRHRVQLGGRRSQMDHLSYKEVLHMLQRFSPVDEVTAVRTELEKTKKEIEALEEDKEALEKHALILKQAAGSADNGSNPSATDWDIHRLLSHNKQKLSSKERSEFERRRGRCLTLIFHNPRGEEAFLSKCGSKQTGRSRLSLHKSSSSNKRKGSGNLAVTTLEPHNCRQGGAGATVRHVSIMPGQSFFLSRDSGSSYTWGRLPNMLIRRMKNEGLDPAKCSGDLLYLSTGPCGYYYAEFRSGECWWGCAGEDQDFYDILQKWDVYRVVFGSTNTFQDDNGNDIILNSWIILGRDGRAAWKNLPSRLHQTLESRLANMAAPAEVSLGSGDSYYVRFLDGSMDYCLPSQIASVCEHVQHSGGTVTDVALHPEVSHEFVVRHTEIPC